MGVGVLLRLVPELPGGGVGIMIATIKAVDYDLAVRTHKESGLAPHIPLEKLNHRVAALGWVLQTRDRLHVVRRAAHYLDTGSFVGLGALETRGVDYVDKLLGIRKVVPGVAQDLVGKSLNAHLGFTELIQNPELHIRH